MIGCFIAWWAGARGARGAATEKEEEEHEGSARGSVVVRVLGVVRPLVCLFFIRMVRSIISIQIKNSERVMCSL